MSMWVAEVVWLADGSVGTTVRPAERGEARRWDVEDDEDEMSEHRRSMRAMVGSEAQARVIAEQLRRLALLDTVAP